MPAPVLIEVAVDSLEDAAQSLRLAADRVEMCSRLDLDGLTPAAADVRRLRAMFPPGSAQIAAMIRPSPTPFTCDDADFAVMLREIDDMIAAGADAIVLGILDEHSRIDTPRCAELVARCNGRDAVFHRAFDRTPDLFESLDQLIDLGFTRVLTSGGAPAAHEPRAVATLARLAEHALGRIQILPGGGVRASNVASILRATGCTQAHSSCRIAGRFETRELTAMRAAVDSANPR